MTPETKYSIRMILLTTSLGGMSYLSFNNGLLLAYFSHLEISSTNILILLALFPMFEFVLMIPFSYLSDIYGKKRIGSIGMGFMFIGFLLLVLTSIVEVHSRIWVAGFGICMFGAGASLTLGNWFALLHPIIPEKIRGRFFGNLRLTWQSVAILFTFVSFYILEKYPSLEVYQAVIGTITLLMAIRIIFYRRIPELEKSKPQNHSLKVNLLKVLAIPDYLAFCAYCFLLMLFTGACPQLFSLIEKDVLNFSGAEIVFIGNLMIVGALAGFVLGGKMVDRFGTKYVFLSCHLGFASICILFLCREMFPFDIQVTVALLTVLFGMFQAASGIAMTSETMALISTENKSLATGVWYTLYNGGMGLSGLLCGQALNLEILNDQWSWFGYPMSQYDGLILICGIMVLLMTVTLGLIPSMIHKTNAQWIPQSS